MLEQERKAGLLKWWIPRMKGIDLDPFLARKSFWTRRIALMLHRYRVLDDDRIQVLEVLGILWVEEQARCRVGHPDE